MTWKYRYRKQILVVSLFILLIASSISLYVVKFDKQKEKDNKKDREIVLTEKKEVKEKNKAKTTNTKIMVDIKGEVVNPGIYTLDDNQRVIDVINMAGGITKNADTSVLNLSKKLKDEMVIIVYSYYEVKNFSYVKEVEKKVQTECSKGINDVENDACIEDDSSSEEESSIISINTATKEELMTLTGIGEKKAEDIIKYREENGEFTSIEDIKNVNGIGDSLFEKIKDYITL